MMFVGLLAQFIVPTYAINDDYFGDANRDLYSSRPNVVGSNLPKEESSESSGTNNTMHDEWSFPENMQEITSVGELQRRLIEEGVHNKRSRMWPEKTPQDVFDTAITEINNCLKSFGMNAEMHTMLLSLAYRIAKGADDVMYYYDVVSQIKSRLFSIEEEQDVEYVKNITTLVAQYPFEYFDIKSFNDFVWTCWSKNGGFNLLRISKIAQRGALSFAQLSLMMTSIPFEDRQMESHDDDFYKSINALAVYVREMGDTVKYNARHRIATVLKSIKETEDENRQDFVKLMGFFKDTRKDPSSTIKIVHLCLDKGYTAEEIKEFFKRQFGHLIVSGATSTNASYVTIIQSLTRENGLEPFLSSVLNSQKDKFDLQTIPPIFDARDLEGSSNMTLCRPIQYHMERLQSVDPHLWGDLMKLFRHSRMSTIVKHEEKSDIAKKVTQAFVNYMSWGRLGSDALESGGSFCEEKVSRIAVDDNIQDEVFHSRISNQSSKDSLFGTRFVDHVLEIMPNTISTRYPNSLYARSFNADQADVFYLLSLTPTRYRDILIEHYRNIPKTLMCADDEKCIRSFLEVFTLYGEDKQGELIDLFTSKIISSEQEKAIPLTISSRKSIGFHVSDTTEGRRAHVEIMAYPDRIAFAMRQHIIENGGSIEKFTDLYERIVSHYAISQKKLWEPKKADNPIVGAIRFITKFPESDYDAFMASDVLDNIMLDHEFLLGLCSGKEKDDILGWLRNKNYECVGNPSVAWFVINEGIALKELIAYQATGVKIKYTHSGCHDNDLLEFVQSRRGEVKTQEIKAEFEQRYGALLSSLELDDKAKEQFAHDVKIINQRVSYDMPDQEKSKEYANVLIKAHIEILKMGIDFMHDKRLGRGYRESYLGSMILFKTTKKIERLLENLRQEIEHRIDDDKESKLWALERCIWMEMRDFKSLN